MSDPLSFLDDDLEDLRARGLLRAAPVAVAPDAVSFCSNDYLGLAALPPPAAPSGAGAARLISGERAEHRRLEQMLAAWLGVDDALLFSSGYAANVGVVSALARPGDLVVSDALNHASIIDGVRLSRARTAVVPHLDLAAVDQALSGRDGGRAFVVVESYFSMDADGPDLAALRRLCDARGAALVVDEAHALGVLGPDGRGRCAEAGIVPDVLVGTLGKAFGAQGAFAAGRAALRAWLSNRARSFVFSTGLAPSSAAAAIRALELVSAGDLREKTLARAAHLRARLAERGVAVLGFGHVVPIVIGEPDRAMRVAAKLREEGFAVQAIRPPTVPAGTSRLRLTVNATHALAELDRLSDAVARALHS